jgi:zinc/manganese transport system substrate-binding protein
MFFKHRSSFLLAGLLALGLGSCGPSANSPNQAQETNNETAEATSQEELQIVTTFLPMTHFTKAVVRDRAEVTQLLPTNTGPHDYQAKPTDVQTIANADVLVKNGLELEVYLEDMIANANNPDLVVINTSEGIATIAYEEEGHDHHDHSDHDHDHDHDHAEHDHGEKTESHDHDHDHGEKTESHDHDHDHGEKAESHDHGEHGHSHDHGEFDPHVWLDPKRAMEQVKNIRDRLIAIDPEGEAIYTENANTYLEKLKALDEEISEKLSPHAGETFITFHDFANYFAESYNLESQFLVDIPEENPSPEDVKRVIDTVQAEGIKTLLTEPQAGENSFSALAKDLNVKVSVFDPVATGDAEAVQPEYYLEVMRQNVNNLVTGLEGSTQSHLLVPQRLRVPGRDAPALSVAENASSQAVALRF